MNNRNSTVNLSICTIFVCEAGGLRWFECSWGRFLELARILSLVWAKREMDFESKVCQDIAWVTNECSETHGCSPGIWTDVRLLERIGNFLKLEELIKT